MTMVSWELDISSLVPERYAAYRPVVADTLLFFLRHLPPSRLSDIVAEQERLPHEASVAQRLAALMRHCPTLHKLGQVIARDRRLAPELRHRLQALESMEAKTTVAAIEPIVRHQLGNLLDLGIELADRPLAEASVAVVVPFSARPSRTDVPATGVLKVLKPGIEARLAEELQLWEPLAAFIEERCRENDVPMLHYSETLDTIRELLSNEIKLDCEQQHLGAAAEFYSASHPVHIPALLPFCTPRITAMERIVGRKVTETGDLPLGTRRRLARSIIQALIAQPVWAPATRSLFHADPHAGNLFVTREGRLAILDWSLVGHLEKHQRIQTMQIVLGAISFDAQRIAQAIAHMTTANPHPDRLQRVAERALNTLLPGKLPGFRWLMDLLDEAMLSAQVQFDENLLLFRKSVLTIEGVVADVSSETSFEQVLPISAARQFLCEWTARWFASPLSRRFGTHVSNLDLLSLYWGIPLSATRYWKHVWAQWLAPEPR